MAHMWNFYTAVNVNDQGACFGHFRHKVPHDIRLAANLTRQGRGYPKEDAVKGARTETENLEGDVRERLRG